jgi:hypothetical protein
MSNNFDKNNSAAEDSHQETIVEQHYVNVLEKNKRLKSNIIFNFRINNPMLVEDPRFRLLILSKYWFQLPRDELYLKVISNPFLEEKDFNNIEMMKSSQERTVGLFSCILTMISTVPLNKIFLKKNSKMGKFLMTFIIVGEYFTLKYFSNKIYKEHFFNPLIEKDEKFNKYLTLSIDEKLVDLELKKYRIGIKEKI